MKKSNLKLKINEITGDYEVIHNGFSWVSSGRRPYIIIKKRRATSMFQHTARFILLQKSVLHIQPIRLLQRFRVIRLSENCTISKSY